MDACGGDSEESALHLSGRIAAIGRVAVASPFFDAIDLELLVRDELRLHAASPEQFSITGLEVRLVPRAAELMSLALHELATNSVKFGALCQSEAKIWILWAITDYFGSRVLQFEWSEAGVKMTAAPPLRGFGSELIERVIARELKGEGKMTLLPDGVRCTIEIPLSDA